jgi:hypothetical protein
MFIVVLLSLLGIVSGLHAFVMRAVNGYEYGSSPTTEWRRFESEKVGSYHLF